MKIILTGYMASGKTGVGQELAQKLNLPFYDLDAEIATNEKKEIRDIFRDSGEIYFRKREMEALKGFLEKNESFVLALGGGTPCYGSNLSLLKESQDLRLIYLKASLETLRERIFNERMTRPLVSHLETREAVEDFIRKHLFERTYYYNQGDLTIDTDNKDFQTISDEIIDRLN